MSPIRRLCLAVLLPAMTVGQDMRENAIGCGDTFRTCEMACLLPKYRSNVALAWPYTVPEVYDTIDSCLSLCKVTRETCVETDVAKDSLACLETCTTTYESATLSCNQVIDDSSKMTFGKNLDACAVSAGSTMDECSSTCYGQDSYHGWTPETEEGTDDDSATSELFSIPNYRAKLRVLDDQRQRALLAEMSTPASVMGSRLRGA